MEMISWSNCGVSRCHPHQRELTMFVSSPSLSRYRKAIRALTNRDETQCVAGMVELLGLGKGQREVISVEAAETVRTIRREAAPGIMEKFLAEYGLNTDEGVALMCLAEAYLRTPDAETLDALISDKIGESDWARHLGRARQFWHELLEAWREAGRVSWQP